jgi:hypothetical protein
MAVNINVPSQVKTYANLAAFPASGALKTIYIAEDTNKTYRWTGSVYVEVSAAGASGITIGTTAITSGTVGRVLFEGTGNVVQESANLFWDNTNARLGVGTSSPSERFVIDGDGVNITDQTNLLFNSRATNASGYSSIIFKNTNTATTIAEIKATVGAGYTNNTLGFFSQGTERMRIFGATGNISINTTTDAGYRLDVNGTARVQGKLTLGNSTASPYQLNVWGGAIESYISLNNTNSGNLNTDGFQIGLESNGTDVYFINRENGFIKFRTNNLDRFSIFSTGNVAINTTTDAGYKLDVNGTARVSGQLTATGGISLGSSVFPTTVANSISLTAHVAATNIVNLSYYTGAQTGTSGIKNVIASAITFSPSSGSAVFNQLNFAPTINQTGGASGITRGLYVNPTLTAAADFRAIETTNGKVIFGNLPTSSAGLPTGAIWNDAGTLKIV